MAAGVKQLKKGDILFREGDPSDAMYVIKKGSIAITKAKGSNEIVLAELRAGEMLGEMAFFDNKPRSAGAKAAQNSEVIALPFASLHAQFKTFPEWLRAMVKTVNSHLRNANQTIKNLQQAETGDETMFTPHTITRFCAVISFMGYKSGEETDEGLQIPYYALRNYTIQIFGQPTNKMDKILDILAENGYLTIEDLGEGKKKLVLLRHKEISDFVDWYNEYLFKEESKRTTVEEPELRQLRALMFYSKDSEPDEKGNVVVNLTDIQNNSMKDLNEVVEAKTFQVLTNKELAGDMQSSDDNTVTLSFNKELIHTITPRWELIYTLLKIPARR